MTMTLCLSPLGRWRTVIIATLIPVSQISTERGHTLCPLLSEEWRIVTIVPEGRGGGGRDPPPSHYLTRG